MKNGDWFIINGTAQTKLPEHYYDVGNFDEHGFAYFATNGKYGVINSEGREVISPQFTRIKSFGFGKFGGIKETSNLMINLSDSIETVSCVRWKILDKYWGYYLNNGTKVLINFPSNFSVEIDSLTKISRRGFGYVFVDYNGAEVLYNPYGDIVDLSEGYAVLEEGYLRLKRPSSHLLILSNNETFELPIETNDFKFDGNYFQYSTPNRTVRVDLFGKVLLDVPFGRLRDAGFNRFIYGDGSKFGVMDGEGNILVPAKYVFINPTRNGYFITMPSGIGILSKSGKEVVPCKFESIKKQGDLYIVESEAGLYGVYSSKLQKLIVPTSFKKITISDDRIRGWLGETLQINYYNDAHEIEKKLTLNNTVSRFSLASENDTDFDRRLLTVGWYYDEKTQFDEEGFNIGTIKKWGIRDATDSIVLKARMKTPTFIPSANFSLIALGVKDVEFMGGTLKKTKLFSGVNLNSGMMMPGQFLDVDTTDALIREYLRFASSQGFGYITQDNKIHPVFHFDREKDTYLRFTTSKTGSYDICDSDNREALRLSTFKLNNQDNVAYKEWRVKGEMYNHIVLNEAKWNFLTPSGTPLFDESFDFADRFFQKTAIVKKEGKWGVVNTDSIFISTKYSAIERMKEFNDTVFLVRQPQRGKQYLNANSSELSLGIEKVEKSMKNYSIVETNSGQLVLDKNNHVISQEGDRFRALNDDYFMTRVNRMSNIYDAKGSLFASIEAKPRDVFFDQFILIRDGASYGLVDDVGDTILPPDLKYIEVWGDRILAVGKTKRILNQNGKELFEFETEDVLLDSVTNWIAVNSGGKISIINAEGKKVTKIKNMDPDVFINGVLFEYGRSGYAKPIDDEQVFTVKQGIKSIESCEQSGFMIETTEGWTLLDKDWQQHPDFGERLFEKCRYLGEGVVHVKKPVNAYFSSKYGLHRFSGRPIKEFDSELGLALNGQTRKYSYYTPAGENFFEQEFDDAEPFKDGYAAVKMNRGWTIIDANGRAKSLDSYGRIEVHGNNIFETENASLFGLIDHHGKVILETEYERLEVLYGNVIQAVKAGEILYFSMDGTAIEY